MYCVAGTTTAKQCYEMSYCPNTTTSIPCPAGYYCATGATAPTPCRAGYFCGPGFYKEAVCVLGYYCPAGVTVYNLCPTGSYCPNTSAAVPCTPGHSCSAGATAQTPCSAGTFASASSSSQCAGCAAGTFANVSAMSACSNCTVCAPLPVTGGACGNASDTIVCGCFPNFYGRGTECVACPGHTYSLLGHTESLLSCRCLAGYVCTYTKRLVATIRIQNNNMTQAYFAANYQTAFIRALARATGVSPSQVVIVATTTGRRLLFTDAGAGLMWATRTMPEEFTVKFHGHGAEGLDARHLLPAMLDPFEFAWQHAHALSISAS